jgi:protein gp37
MAKPGWWWDASWNVAGGCSLVSPGCLNCYAARAAATLQTATDIPLYLGTTDQVNGRYVFNDKLTVLTPGHDLWTSPLKWPGAARPVMGRGRPSLIFVSDMADLFREARPTAIINRVLATIAASDHIGLVLTKRPKRMLEFFERLPPRTVARWKPKLWLGFSAERQCEFIGRWPLMRRLAERGWLVFVSVAPMLAPVRLPDDFNGRWVIVSGEQGPHKHVRRMEASWARSIRDQCRAAGIPFFMKQMAGKRPIPPDLLIREFPHRG